METSCIIIGGGHVAAQLAPTLRLRGWKGGITVIGEEPALPYQRPALSKDYLSGMKGTHDILIRPAQTYEKGGIHVLPGTRVVSIDRERKEISTGRQRHAYDKLVLATGARARRLEIPGAELAGVHYLRTLADVDGIKAHVAAGRNAVIIGGGYVGLETAAVLNKLGMNVTLLEAASRVLQRVTGPDVSAFFERIHSEEGVAIRTNTAVQAIEGTGAASCVRCSDGSRFDADLVIVGIGVLPAVELAETAGLHVEDGIMVNALCQTSDPDIFAAGDCGRHFNPIYQRWVRLESVQNANDQANVIAGALCGLAKPYDALPWFWSDQYDVKLQIAGLSEGYERIVLRGDPAQNRRFAAFYMKDDTILAVDAVNRAQDFMIAKSLIAKSVKMRDEDIADEGTDLKHLI